jgi:hypothetical protein
MYWRLGTKTAHKPTNGKGLDFGYEIYLLDQTMLQPQKRGSDLGKVQRYLIQQEWRLKNKTDP